MCRLPRSRRMRRPEPAASITKNKPNNALFTDVSQNDNPYYEIQLKGNSPAMTVSHKKKSIEKQEINTIYSTLTSQPTGLVKQQALLVPV
ncbi:hypothetical protein GDO78_019318 [Eleutherodactylus coqui]|uniref:Uncharacterized protein n=1 Tax=Eleutherodactylus coqui TaxID=57060 RepID=A0A8J6E994_ELECQ|nr:hypothetical protein GDO78_019318 [Eleutherodactylus coqui]